MSPENWNRSHRDLDKIRRSREILVKKGELPRMAATDSGCCHTIVDLHDSKAVHIPRMAGT